MLQSISQIVPVLEVPFNFLENCLNSAEAQHCACSTNKFQCIISTLVTIQQKTSRMKCCAVKYPLFTYWTQKCCSVCIFGIAQDSLLSLTGKVVSKPPFANLPATEVHKMSAKSGICPHTLQCKCTERCDCYIEVFPMQAAMHR